MKRSILLALAVLAFASIASASNITVLNTDTNTYTKGVVCTIDAPNSAFENVFRASDFSTDHGNPQSAMKLLTFMRDNTTVAACYALPDSGHGTVSISDTGETYVVVILMAPSGKPYWSITNVAGGIDQVVTAP